MHRVLGVVPVSCDKLFALSTTATPVCPAADAQQSHTLGLHVAAVPGHYVAADEGVGEVSQLVSFVRG